MSEVKVLTYADVAGINVNDHIEKKGQLSYLSWPWAVDQLLRLDPDAQWGYGEPITFSSGTMMVSCTVTAFGRSRTMHLPVMNHLNKAIPNPDAFAVNTAMQRCLVKTIALHGLGLYIYAGEDLPPSDGPVDNAERDALLDDLKSVADAGMDAYKATWLALSKEAKDLVGAESHKALKERAVKAVEVDKKVYFGDEDR